MEWISVNRGLNLPEKTKNGQWGRYIISAILTYSDVFEGESENRIVTTALYDHNQKIWHLDIDMCINAMTDIVGRPLCCDYVTHWMPLPCSPSKEEARSMYDFVNFLVAEHKKQGSDTLVIKECPKMRFPDPPEEVKRKLSKLGKVYVSHFTEATEEGDLELHEYNIYFGNAFTEESLDGLVRVLDENCGYVTEQPAEQLARKLYDNGFRLITRK